MAVSSLVQLFLRYITRTICLSTSNRRLMARNEDDFRIRPGKVRDRGGGQITGRLIGAARGRPTSFVGEV
jgi:hypothetical protein